MIKSRYLISIIIIFALAAAALVLFKTQVEAPGVDNESPPPAENSTPDSDENPAPDEDVILPTPVTLNSPQVNIESNVMVVKLSWDIDSESNPEFSLYKIYRSTDNFDKVSTPIAEIPLKDRRTHTDLVSIPGTYYYKLVVIDNAGLRAESNVVMAQP